jgi:hypothetical protein
MNKVNVRPDPLWQVQLAAFSALLLQFILPDKFLGGSKIVLLILEGILLIALFLTTPKTVLFQSIKHKLNAITLIGLVGIANLFTLQRLTHILLQSGHITNGRELLFASVNIYITNIIIFGMLCWEIDGGGPGKRHNQQIMQRDFVFPQMSILEYVKSNWHPSFMDYLYLSITNATAFSPTDTMPMRHRAKLLMAVQATASLITVALIAARAVNILN